MKPLHLLAPLFVFACPLVAETITPAMQAKIDVHVAEIKTWAADPVIIQAVISHNGQSPREHLTINQANWKDLPATSPLIVSFTQNPAGLFLKSKRASWVGEAFLSDARGFKVAFLDKPSHWSHAGYAKHSDVMAGKLWQGRIEQDESSGLRAVQVSVPVLGLEQKPIGSLVVGIPVAQLN
ncbi:MAG: hypothetical protein K0R17_683 [Rariglobus sp.]|jgi:hypothetical protein|nr:hypothetical protein [Rariglobus sp.]